MIASRAALVAGCCLTLIASGALPLSEARGDERERAVSQRYAGNGGQLDEAKCGRDLGSGAGLSGLLVELQTLRGETGAHLRIVDDVGGDNTIAVVGQSGSPYRYEVICGRTERPIPIALSGEPLDVWLLNGTSERGTSVVTQGTIEAWFYSPSPPPPPPPPSSDPTPSPETTAEAGHEVTFEAFSLHKHLRARGVLSSGTADCLAGAGVAIQRRSGTPRSTLAWRTVTTTSSDGSGAFDVRLADRPGRYRARVTTSEVESGTCSGATSRARHHRH